VAQDLAPKKGQRADVGRHIRLLKVAFCRLQRALKNEAKRILNDPAWRR
jgi:hypothetical protein